MDNGRFSMIDLFEKIIQCLPESLRKKTIIKETKELPTLAIARTRPPNEHLILLVNREWTLNQLKEGMELETLIAHEAFHAIFSHCHIPDAEKLDRQKLLVSTDCQVNSYLYEMQRDPFVYPQKFKLPIRKNWKWYYDNLPKDMSESISCSMSLTPEQMKEVKKELEAIAKKHGLEITKEFDKVETKPVKNINSSLRSKLERVLGNTLNMFFEKTRTAQRPHKYLEDQIGKRRLIGPSILYAIDTSGSTSGEQQLLYYSTIKRVLKEWQGFCVEFTTEICHKGKRPSNKQRSGGTDFTVVQKWIKKSGKNFDAVVWFTDGESTFNRDKAQKYIVVLSGNSNLDHVKKFADSIISL